MPDLGNKRIFILEPSSLVRRRLLTALEADGAEVRADDRPDRALMEIIHWHPDLLVMSVNLGMITGFDLCLVLKMMPEHARIPVIIISSCEEDAVRRQMSDVGADRYVHKDKDLVKDVSLAARQILVPAEPEPARAGNSICGAVLVVDDSSVMRRIVANMLTNFGISEIFQAEDGRAALSVLAEQQIGVVLTDWNMPTMNGLELVAAIRGESRLQDLPIIMVTTEGGKHERSIAMEAGVNALLSKPFSNERLRDVMEPFLDHVQHS